MCHLRYVREELFPLPALSERNRWYEESWSATNLPTGICCMTEKEPVKNEEGHETGDTRVVYKEAVKRRDNVSAATGSAQVEQFGNFISYDKVIVTDDLTCPIDENTVLFIDKSPEYDDDGNPLYDYIVKRVARSLNSISYAVSKVTVS